MSTWCALALRSLFEALHVALASSQVYRRVQPLMELGRDIVLRCCF